MILMPKPSIHTRFPKLEPYDCLFVAESPTHQTAFRFHLSHHPHIPCLFLSHTSIQTQNKKSVKIIPHPSSLISHPLITNHLPIHNPMYPVTCLLTHQTNRTRKTTKVEDIVATKTKSKKSIPRP